MSRHDLILGRNYAGMVLDRLWPRRVLKRTIARRLEIDEAGSQARVWERLQREIHPDC